MNVTCKRGGYFAVVTFPDGKTVHGAPSKLRKLKWLNQRLSSLLNALDAMVCQLQGAAPEREKSRVCAMNAARAKVNSTTHLRSK